MICMYCCATNIPSFIVKNPLLLKLVKGAIVVSSFANTFKDKSRKKRVTNDGIQVFIRHFKTEFLNRNADLFVT